MNANTVDIATAAERLGVSGERIRQMCLTGKLPGAKKCGRIWQIPTTAHVKLAAAAQGSQTADDFKRLPKHKQDLALWRAGLIAKAETFIAAALRSGAARSQAMAAFCRDADVSVRSVQRWMRDYRREGIGGLVDRRGRINDGPEITPEAWNEFMGLWLSDKKPSVKQIYMILCFKNTQQELGWRIPSLRRLQQMAAENIPEPVRVLHREGQAAYDAKCAPYLEVDLAAIEPGAVWIGDHHQFDCWVRFRGKWIRPWITAWEDMRSRTIVGFKITDAPNSTTILQAFRLGVKRFGPPAAVKIDNGKDYDSELFTGTTKQRRRLTTQVDEANVAGIYAMMNIGVSFSIPYHPQSKAIERWFDTLEGQFVRTLPTYCGKDTQRRPEHVFDYMKTQRAVDEATELDEFAELVGQYIEVYNNTAHTGRGMGGATPMQVMQTRTARRVVDQDTLELLCQVWTGKQKVGKNGVTVRGVAGFGKYDPLLHQYFGREVRMAYDPEDMTAVRVYDAHTYRYVTTAEHPQLVGYQVNEDDIRKQTAAKARARRTVKQYKPAAQVAHTDLTHLSIQAAAERTRATEPAAMPAMQPVTTPVTGQGAAVRRTERMRRIKRAAGADMLTHAPELTLDFDIPAETGGVELNFDFQPKPKQGHLKLSLCDD